MVPQPSCARNTRGRALSPSHSPPSPSLTQNATQREAVFFQPTPAPSLAQKARWRGFPPFQPTTIPLPRSKYKMEWSFLLPIHHCSPPSLKAQDRGGLSCASTHYHPLPRSNPKTEGFPPSQSTTIPSLARSARWRGLLLTHPCSSCSLKSPSNLPPSPPLLKS